jgi:hypothetical protein
MNGCELSQQSELRLVDHLVGAGDERRSLSLKRNTRQDSIER